MHFNESYMNIQSAYHICIDVYLSINWVINAIKPSIYQPMIRNTNVYLTEQPTNRNNNRRERPSPRLEQDESEASVKIWERQWFGFVCWGFRPISNGGHYRESCDVSDPSYVSGSIAEVAFYKRLKWLIDSVGGLMWWENVHFAKRKGGNTNSTKLR